MHAGVGARAGAGDFNHGTLVRVVDFQQRQGCSVVLEGIVLDTPTATVTNATPHESRRRALQLTAHATTATTVSTPSQMMLAGVALMGCSPAALNDR